MPEPIAQDPNAGAASPQEQATSDASPFDRWVDYKLRQIYNPVLEEPIPSQLLDLIERHCRKAHDGNGES